MGGGQDCPPSVDSLRFFAIFARFLLPSFVLEIYACHGKVETFKYPLKILIGAAPAGG